MANKNMKRISVSVAVREKQIKTTLRHHFTPTRCYNNKEKKEIGDGEDVEKLKPSYIVSRNVKYYCYGKHFGNCSKFNIELIYDPPFHS